MDTTDKNWKVLLEKWHSGNFTRSDEAALQRLMAESGDDFLREATEGYLSNSETDHQAGLERLRQRLALPEAAPKQVTLWPRWAAAAAAAILLVGGIWWLNRMPDEQAISGRLPIDQPNAAPQGSAATNLSDRTKMKSKPSETAADPMAKAVSPTKESATMDTDQPEPKASLDAKTDNAEAKKEEIAANEQPPQAVYSPNNAVKRVELEETDPSDAAKNKQSAKPAPVNPNANQFPVGTHSNTGPPPKLRNAIGTQPVPEGGWEKFKTDMAKEMKVTQLAKDNGVKSGVSNMILDIKPTDGKIRSVLFINRLGYGCDELAEQFVRKYIWTVTPGGPTHIEVEIEFGND
jgi:hypothetical protein